jgi:hypothetical protein
VGGGTVIAGGVIIVTTWYTGVGDGAGGAVVVAGGTVYTVGTALSTIGNFAKWLGGQPNLQSVAGMMEAPTVGLGPAGQIGADLAVSYFADKVAPDQC